MDNVNELGRALSETSQDSEPISNNESILNTPANDNTKDSKDGGDDGRDDTFRPTMADVLEVKSLIQRASGLPAELVEVIIEAAEYWVCSTACVKEFHDSSIQSRTNFFRGLMPTQSPKELCVRSGSALAVGLVLRSLPVGCAGIPGEGVGKNDASESPYFTYSAVSTAPLRRGMTAEELQQSIPLPRGNDTPEKPGETLDAKPDTQPDNKPHLAIPLVSSLQHPCRKIVFTIESHDQGWASGDPREHGTYEFAYSWFDVGLERLEGDKGGETVEEKEKENVREMKKEKRRSKEEENTEGTIRRRYGNWFKPRIAIPDAAGPSSFFNPPPPPPSGPILRPPPPSFPLSALRTVLPPRAGKPDDSDDSEVSLPNLSMPPASPTLAHPDLPNDMTLQRNLVARKDFKTHRIVWSRTDGLGGSSDDVTVTTADKEALAKAGRGKATGDGRFVRELRVGDIVTVWAKARFGGWSNTVKSAKIEVYWAV